MAAKHDSGKELDSIKEYYRYNSYVRKKYLNALEKLPREEQLMDRGASFPSMLDIFVHVLDAYSVCFMFRYPGLDGFKGLRGNVKSLEEARGEEGGLLCLEFC